MLLGTAYYASNEAELIGPMRGEIGHDAAFWVTRLSWHPSVLLLPWNILRRLSDNIKSDEFPVDAFAAVHPPTEMVSYSSKFGKWFKARWSGPSFTVTRITFAGLQLACTIIAACFWHAYYVSEFAWRTDEVWNNGEVKIGKIGPNSMLTRLIISLEANYALFVTYVTLNVLWPCW